MNNMTHSASPLPPQSPSLNDTANVTHHQATILVTIPSSLSAILPIEAASSSQWVRESREDWHFLDLSRIPWNMDRDKSTHSHWFPIVHTQKIGTSLVAASEDETCDQNGKPPTPPYLNSTITSIRLDPYAVISS